MAGGFHNLITDKVYNNTDNNPLTANGEKNETGI